MFHAKLFRFCTSFILLGLVVVPHVYAIHYDRSAVWVPPESEAFPVTAAQRAAWDRVVEDCLPLNTRTALSARCMTALGEYFPNEPVWSYSSVYAYDVLDDAWNPFTHYGCSQRRNHSPADFLNPDIPLLKDIFDDQIEQRQERFLQVVNDSVCQDLASPETGVLSVFDT